MLEQMKHRLDDLETKLRDMALELHSYADIIYGGAPSRTTLPNAPTPNPTPPSLASSVSALESAADAIGDALSRFRLDTSSQPLSFPGRGR
jgi:hypothetical protein